MAMPKRPPPTWGNIFVTLILTGLTLGLTLGLVNEVIPLSPSVRTSGIGAGIGVVGGLLISRKLRAQKKP